MFKCLRDHCCWQVGIQTTRWSILIKVRLLVHQLLPLHSLPKFYSLLPYWFQTVRKRAFWSRSWTLPIPLKWLTYIHRWSLLARLLEHWAWFWIIHKRSAKHFSSRPQYQGEPLSITWSLPWYHSSFPQAHNRLCSQWAFQFFIRGASSQC
jgi:hypothetical protein